MDKKLKNIIEKVIDMKYQEVQELNFSDIEEDEKREHSQVNERKSEIFNKLMDSSTCELKELLAEYEELETQSLCLECRYMFNRGVKMGITDLSFIKDELGLGVIELGIK